MEHEPLVHLDDLAFEPRPPQFTPTGDAADRFGAERCMFESNFPVDKFSLSYRVFWNAAKKLAAGCSESEQEALFRGTASRIYRL